MKRVLLLEPYYGGSHKQFLTGLQQWIDAEFVLLYLPARKWKMRMQFSAVYFAEQIRAMSPDKQQFDLLLCSTFVDVAVLRALLARLVHWNDTVPVKTYFHENQFAYPVQQEDVSMRQFAAINYSTALASDSCAFNSQYNLDSFQRGVRLVLKRAPDMNIGGTADEILQKSVVLHPGMDYSCIDAAQTPVKEKMPVIVWNHRWEHDKGPEVFFEALYLLQKKKITFGLIVLGQSHPDNSACFSEAKARLAKECIHFAYVDSKEQYAELLKRGDIVVSTARHEFFGIAVLEAIRAGCYPLLPDDLSYPELYPKQYLYTPGKLAHKLEELLLSPIVFGERKSRELTERFAWQHLQNAYKRWLFAD